MCILDGKNFPLRKCIGCGIKKSKKEFIAVVRSPKNSEISNLEVFDGIIKKDGRSAYICKNLECFAKTKKSRKLEKTFKRQIDNDIYEKIEKMILEFEEKNGK